VAHFVQIKDEMGRNSLNDFHGVLEKSHDYFGCDVEMRFLHWNSATSFDPGVPAEEMPEHVSVNKLFS
jgi:hypothetical protein